MALWLERLAEYDFEVVHRVGKNHANADWHSRRPSTPATVTDHAQWITPSLETEFCKKPKQSLFLIFMAQQSRTPQQWRNKKTPRKLGYNLARLNKLTLKDKILKLLNNSDDGITTIFRAIVPKRARQQILELAHSLAKKYFEI